LTAPAARPRAARRALDDLSLNVDDRAIDWSTKTEPDWLTADRTAALDAHRELPAETNLLYTPYIDLRAAQLQDVQLAAGPSAGPVDNVLPSELEGLIEVEEGVLVARSRSDAMVQAGVTIDTVGETEAYDRFRDLLVDGASLPATDKFAQLTRAAWSQAVVIDIPAGVILERPVVVRWSAGRSGSGVVGRTIVRLGDGASASVVEELVASGDEAIAAAEQAFFAGTMEVTLGAGAALQVASLQELPANVVAVQHRTANIGEGATLQWALAQLGGRVIRSRVDNRLVGDRSSVRQVEIVFGADEQLFDLTSYTRHIGKNTTGDLLSKAALLEKSRTYMKGLITIERSANGTDSFLGEFGMNLSKNARSVAIPSLEIDQPDCRRAAHSSSVGPVDETQLFYLESRGIPPDEARKFIVLGFLEPVVARVPLASAQDRLRELLEAKWIAGTDGVAGEAAA
jgi:Fe-S cluster assembly scaffold protein SufB